MIVVRLSTVSAEGKGILAVIVTEPDSVMAMVADTGVTTQAVRTEGLTIKKGCNTDGMLMAADGADEGVC